MKAIRLAAIVSHPIQYYVPLYRRLAARSDVDLKVFFTWHAGETAQHDPGFGKQLHWDIPLTTGYDYELVPNASRHPGSDRFFGIRSRQLCGRVRDWQPDAVQITGYAYASHLWAMRELHREGMQVVFRGDSHLLDRKSDLRWQLKKRLLRKIYKWTSACLFVGQNNYDYYRAVGVPKEKLFYCPHSIEVSRFSEPDKTLVSEARAWRTQLNIPSNARVLVYAGKFEARKQPLELMRAVLSMERKDVILIMIGDGEQGPEIHKLAAGQPERFRVLAFQNQSRMPVVYRLGEVVVLPSAYGETWGLALNEAIASGRRVLASDRVGGAVDLIKSISDGAIFAKDNWEDFRFKLVALLNSGNRQEHLLERAREFDIAATEEALRAALEKISNPRRVG